jgi:[protein-PII] uridylyltransferase
MTMEEPKANGFLPAERRELSADPEWAAVRAHARERLGGVSEERRTRVEAFRRFLKLETERLRMRHQLGLSGLEIAAARSYQIDVLVSRAAELCEADLGRIAQRELAYGALVALGGYGRGELAAGSDVDLLFLHPGRPSAAARDFVERVLQVLWDVGLTVGHSFRSLRECLDEARIDLHSRTALGEARLLRGSLELFSALLREADAALRKGRAVEQFLDAMRRDIDARYEKYGRTVCVLEPNLKEGPGGLRDLHAALWVGHACHGARGLYALRADGWISEQEHRAARRACDFLWRVRHEAHFTSGRKTDLLTHDLHEELAAGLGYRSRGGLLASELLMRDYYRRASELHRFSRSFLLSRLDGSRRRLVPEALRRRRLRGFEARDGQLHLERGATALKGGAAHLLDAFETAQTENVPLAEPLTQAIRERAPELLRGFRASRDAARFLWRVLGRRGHVAPALRALHETGVLGRLLPEFARVTFLIQHDYFHKYTVDEHTLKAIEALDEVAQGKLAGLPRLARAMDELEDAAPLYLGMLLHDVGKGQGGGHVARGAGIAERVVARLRLDRDAADKAVFLVSAHLEMSQISQRRDLSEARPIEAFAARVQTVERLNLLLLLTYADHCAVGPGIWNEWKAALLFELFDRTRACLMGEAAEVPSQTPYGAAIAELSAEFPAEEVERHFSLMPERYLRAGGDERMARHFRLARSRGDAPAAFEWSDHPGGHWSELVIVADDRPGLLAQLAGTLTAHDVDILNVDVFTRADGLVLDTFRVSESHGHRALRPERREKLEHKLLLAVAGKLDVGASVEAWRARAGKRSRRAGGRAARPPVVRFDQQASASATVVEVKAPDQPGLVYAIASALAGLGLDIGFARIATSKALALDVFYVRDEQGRKLQPDAMAAVEEALLRMLGGKGRTDARRLPARPR